MRFGLQLIKKSKKHLQNLYHSLISSSPFPSSLSPTLTKCCKNFCSLFSFIKKMCSTRTCIIPLENLVNISDYSGRSFVLFIFVCFFINFSCSHGCLERQCQEEGERGLASRRAGNCVFLHFQEDAVGRGGGQGELREKGRRDLASSSGRVTAFNEVQMSLCWQRRAGGEREGWEGGEVATL